MKSRGPAGRGSAPVAPRRGVAPWWRHPALISAVLALLLFLPAVRYGFVRDDRDLFADNPFMTNSGYLWRLVSSDYWTSTGFGSGLWRPLVSLSFWVEGRLFSWLPAGFHAVNLVSHALVSALVALLVTALGGSVAMAWVAGLWFALLPTHVEPVAWISGRTDVWCALFGLLALWLHERAARGWWGWRIASLLAFAMALGSKESAAPLFAVLAAIVWQRRAGEAGRPAALLRELAPYAVLGLVWAVAHANIATAPMATTPGWPRPTRPELIWTTLALFPSQLAFLLPGFPHGPDWWIAPARSAADPRVALGLVLHAAAAFLCVKGLRSRYPVTPAVLLLWLPSLMMSWVVFARGVIVQGERHVYLASAGAAWLIGIGGMLLWRRGLAPTTLPRVLLPILFGALLIFNIERSLVQLAGWRSDATMYRAMVRAQPERADGYLGVALVAIGERKDRVALGALARAETIDSTRYEIATYRAAVASRAGAWPEVIHWSRRAIQLGAPESDPWLMQINALQSLRRWPEARALVDTMRSRFKSDPDVAAAYGRQMIGEGTPERAVRPLEYAISWSPDDASLRVLLGDAYMRSNKPEKAVDEFRRAAAMRPNDTDVWLRLAVLYHQEMQVALRDDAIRAAASLPGADTTMLRAFYNRLLQGGPPAEP